jgi:hypothetical protein
LRRLRWPWLTQRFLLKCVDAVHIYSKNQAVTRQLRHEVPTEVDLAGTSFKAALALTPVEIRISFGELSAAVAEAEERPI